jgi:LmbE family N-acetylglucosaminyl deacetylase
MRLRQGSELNEVETPDNWDSPQRILVVLAHPDDPEFFCGGTIVRWIKAGHHVSYCLLTCGDKGTNNRELTPDDLCTLRQNEQKAAAAVLGVHQVLFLDHPDGYLVPDLELRKEIEKRSRG